MKKQTFKHQLITYNVMIIEDPKQTQEIYGIAVCVKEDAIFW